MKKIISFFSLVICFTLASYAGDYYTVEVYYQWQTTTKYYDDVVGINRSKTEKGEKGTDTYTVEASNRAQAKLRAADKFRQDNPPRTYQTRQAVRTSFLVPVTITSEYKVTGTNIIKTQKKYDW